MRNGNFLKMHVSEIRVKQIPVNQGIGVHSFVSQPNLQLKTPRAHKCVGRQKQGGMDLWVDKMA